MSGSEFHQYTRDEFLAEFYPRPGRHPVTHGQPKNTVALRKSRSAALGRCLPSWLCRVGYRRPLSWF